MSFSKVLREEFKFRNLSLDFHNNKVFYMSQWHFHPLIYVSLRVLMAAYTDYAFVRIIFTWNRDERWFTVWSYFLLLLHMVVSAGLCIYFYSNAKDDYENPVRASSNENLETVQIDTQEEAMTGHDCDIDISSNYNPESSTSELSTSCSLPQTLFLSFIDSRITTTFDTSNSSAPQISTVENSSVNNCKRSTTEENTDAISSHKLKTILNTSKNRPKTQTMEKSTENRKDGLYITPWYFKVSWCLSNITCVVSLFLTLVYWSSIYDGQAINQNNIHLHVINSVLVILDQTISARPVRLLHAYQPAIYGFIYVIFNFTYFYTVDPPMNKIYDIFNWDDFGTALRNALLSFVFGLPIVQILIFGNYRLKLWLHLKLYGYHLVSKERPTPSCDRPPRRKIIRWKVPKLRKIKESI